MAIKVPVEKPTVSPHAMIGIFAVSLAAINSSLGSGLLSVGLEDLRGAWGIGIDDAAYIPTAFNAAQMFMGPLSIMLAARFGHRQVLLYAGFIYALCSLFLPLVPPTVPVLMLLILAGLSAGTFLPLCLSFITRNLPLPLVTFGVAAYNLDILATNHVIHALEGFYMDHASWHWLFWNQAILTIPMLFCVHLGIPATPKEHLIPHFRYAGLLYISGGLTLLYIALDQGERLDWYNNGLINGLAISGLLLLLAAVIRRYRLPNPYLDFSYLRNRNILLLGFLQIIFRSLLLRVVLIIPMFLELLHQYRNPEIGALFTLSVVPFLIAMPTLAHFLRKVRVRPMLLAGFAITSLINFHDAHALSTWIRDDFVVCQMIGAIGICMVAMATMSGIVFEGRMTGAYLNREGAYCQGAFFQVVRLFGSIAAASEFRRYILFREHYWNTNLVSSLQISWPFNERAADLAIALAPQTAGPIPAQNTATTLIAKAVNTQSLTLALDDSFMLMAWVCVIGLISVAMMRKIPLPRELPEADALPAERVEPAKQRA